MDCLDSCTSLDASALWESFGGESAVAPRHDGPPRTLWREEIREIKAWGAGGGSRKRYESEIGEYG